jgi:5'-nucleotidase
MQLVLPLPDLVVGDPAHRPSREERVFVNRSLRFDQIEAVGFDMDYTLALYRQAEMDRQSVEATVPKLLALGWPDVIASMQLRHDFPIRGLLIDRKLGNVIKMDRHRYVKRAYHGYRELDVEERRASYAHHRVRSIGGRYHFVDTLYALSEVSMFASAIEVLEAAGHVVDFDKLFTDIRTSMDLSHQDGTILDHILADPARFIERDLELGPMLHKLRSAGKKLFLLTNSHAPYTERVMHYLLDGLSPAYPTWQKYFDLVITASRKPTFFTGTTPFDEVVGTERVVATSLERGHIYAGGNLADLEKALGVPSDRVLYVGDHIFGDVLRAKRDTAWRTVMVIQEMRDELADFARTHAEHERLDALEDQRSIVLDDMREHSERLRRIVRKLEEHTAIDTHRKELEAEKQRHKRAVERLKARLRAIEAEHADVERAIDTSYHPYWGSVFKAGPEVSSFGDQVEEYACLYTSRASNLVRYSAMHFFQSPRERMPHEL